MTRARVVNTLAVVVAAALVAGVVLLVRPGARTTTITADFAEAPGLYVGNHVDVLGIPVGTVTSVKANATDVVVRMRVDADQPIPAGATAILEAPDVVNDRYVQLTPAYTGGPRLVSGAVIPTARTGLPVTVDQVFDSIDELATALGPNGANSHGTLSQLIHRLAQSLKGNGAELNRTITASSEALTGLASNPTQLAALLDNLGQLTHALADNTTSYESFAGDLQSVSASLAADNSDTAAALSSLQQLFANLTTFVQDNQSALGTSVANLRAFATKLASEQKALAASIDVGPLALQNLDAAVDHDVPGGGAALTGRYDPSSAGDALVASVCGNPLLRGLTVATSPTQRTELDVDCLFNEALGSLPDPPDASTGPDLGLSALIGAG
jgi:phospholipid/cholesterol/gamma-HCH transport system substrate-binding protein